MRPGLGALRYPGHSPDPRRTQNQQGSGGEARAEPAEKAVRHGTLHDSHRGTGGCSAACTGEGPGRRRAPHRRLLCPRRRPRRPRPPPRSRRRSPARSRLTAGAPPLRAAPRSRWPRRSRGRAGSPSSVVDGTTWETILANAKATSLSEIPAWGSRRRPTAPTSRPVPEDAALGKTMWWVATYNLYYVLAPAPLPGDPSEGPPRLTARSGCGTACIASLDRRSAPEAPGSPGASHAQGLSAARPVAHHAWMKSDTPDTWCRDRTGWPRPSPWPAPGARQFYEAHDTVGGDAERGADAPRVRPRRLFGRPGDVDGIAVLRGLELRGSS